MLSRIDAIRRTDVARRGRRPDTDTSEPASNTQPARLPVPVGRVERSPPRGGRQNGQAIFAAQLMGQDGAKRGLRAGPDAFDRANTLYNRTEWSGSKDRRAHKGGIARTEA